MFLVNSRYPRFAATPSSSGGKRRHPLGHTLSRGYGINLQSSFTRVLSSALVFSTYLPVSVCGTDTETAPPAAFLGSRASTISPATCVLGVHHISTLSAPLIVRRPPTCLNRAFQQPARLAFSVPAGFNANSVVQECSPAYHRLRPWASA